MKTYYGLREKGVARVRVVDDREDVGGHAYLLPLRLELYNHSPTGFEWGYGGSGPAQTALALLADALGDDGRALRWHQDYKREVVCGLPATEYDPQRHLRLCEEWALTDAEIRAWVEQQERGH